MFTYTKFFNIDSPEQVSTPSIAELMAKQGTVITESDNRGEMPRIIQQESTVPPVEAKEPNTATVEVQAETANQESPTPQAEAQPTLTTPIEEKPEVVVPTWQEVLKQQQPDTIFKELGVDGQAVEVAKMLQQSPQMKAFIEHWQNNGDVTTYLRELTTDYSKMPSEEVMRHNLRREYPKATDRQLEILFQEEVVDRYKLDPEKYSEEEVERGRLLLDAKADRHRDELAANQQNFLLPKPPEKPTVEQKPDNTEQLRQEFETYKNTVNNDPYVKNVFANKMLSIGEGEDRFNYPMPNPQVLTDLLFDSAKFGESLFNVEMIGGQKKLTPNVQKQMLVAAILKDEKAFLTEYAKHYRTLGEKAAIDPIVNAKPPENSHPSKTESVPASPAGAMARSGRLVN